MHVVRLIMHQSIMEPLEGLLLALTAPHQGRSHSLRLHLHELRHARFKPRETGGLGVD
jgi:hypothetical protein